MHKRQLKPGDKVNAGQQVQAVWPTRVILEGEGFPSLRHHDITHVNGRPAKVMYEGWYHLDLSTTEEELELNRWMDKGEKFTESLPHSKKVSLRMERE